MFPPPPVHGLGTIGGFKLQIEDRAGLGYEALNDATQGVHRQGAQTAPELAGLFSSYPGQRAAALRRHRPHQGAAARRARDQTCSTRMQIYLGSLYVNDFNRFGRTYSVRVQADAPFRARADDIGQLKVRNGTGEMVPLSALLKVKQSAGPERAMRYNGFLAADINGGAGARLFDRARRRPRWRRIAAETLPQGIAFEWTDLTYQEILAGNSALLVFPLGAAAGVPGARRAVREPDAAAGDHHDRADGPAGRDARRLARPRATTTSSPRSA